MHAEAELTIRTGKSIIFIHRIRRTALKIKYSQNINVMTTKIRLNYIGYCMDKRCICQLIFVKLFQISDVMFQ
jgi:hypothetical protein